MVKKEENDGKIIVNKLSFWAFLLELKRQRAMNRHKVTPTKEMNEESAKVKALIRQVSALEKINESLFTEIDELTKFVGKGKSTNMQEKLIEMAGNLFLNNSPSKTIQSPLSDFGGMGVPPESVSYKEYSDEELKTIVSKIPQHNKSQIKSAPIDLVISQARNFIPDISENSVKKMVEMI